MSDNRVLERLGYEHWITRDINLFKNHCITDHYASKSDRYTLIHGNVGALKSVIILPDGQPYTKMINNFCKFLLIGYDSNIVVLQNSSKGMTMDDALGNNQPSYIISFVEFQNDTSNLNNNVLILNNVDFSELEKSITYKKQVLLDVLRISISPIGDK